MKASEFFSILCDQILTPVEGMTAEDFDKFPPLILSHLETVERADKQALKGQVRNLEGYLKSAGTTIPSLEQELAILRSALRLKERSNE